jgi:hypothetical protein
MTDRVHLVFSLPNHPGKKVYFHRLSEVSDGRRGMQAQTAPVFNDEIQFTTWYSPDVAVQQRDHWRERGYRVVIEDRLANVLFEREQSSEPRYNDFRVRRFVLFTNGLGLYAVPCNTPDGPRWTVRAIDIPAFAENNRHTSIESVFGNTPEEAAQRATDSWGQQILFENPEAVTARERQQRQAEQQKLNSRFAGVRPGDRR